MTNSIILNPSARSLIPDLGILGLFPSKHTVINKMTRRNKKQCTSARKVFSTNEVCTLNKTNYFMRRWEMGGGGHNSSF